jgi:ABC-type sugar transport system substrate-binding protein
LGSARRITLTLTLTLAAALIAAGCGSSGLTTSAANKSIDKASGSKSQQAQMATLGAAAAAKAGPAVTLKPETIGMIEVLHAAEVQQRITNALKAAAAKVGWKVITCDTAGDPSKASSCANELLTQGVTAMTSMGVDPTGMAQQMKEAKAKGIPWIGLVGTEPDTPAFTAQINQPDHGSISALMSQYILQRLNAAGAASRMRGGFAYSTFPAIYGIGLRDDATAAALKASGVSMIARHVTDLTNEAQDSRQWTQSVLARNPNIGAIYTTLDIDQSEIADAVAQKFPGKSFPARPLVVGLAAGLATLDKIRRGTLDADAEVAVEAASWMGIDQLAAWFAHKTPIATDLYSGHKTGDYPVWFLKAYMVTKANAPAQSGVYHAPPYDFVTFFSTKWAREYKTGS